MLKKVILLSFILFFSCENEEKGKKVQAEIVGRDQIIEKVEGIGQIKPELEVKISSDVAGRIIEINGKPGDFVRKGDVLIKIDPKNYIAIQKRAASMLKSSEANLAKAKAEYNRSQELFEKGLISSAELEISEANYKVQKSQVDQARASLSEAEENLAKCTITAPIDGTITAKNKENGEIAQGSGFTLDVIMVIADLSKMETVVEVSENEIVKVNLNQECDLEVDAFPNKTFKGKVTEIANSAKTAGLGTSDQVTNFEVKISIVDKELRFRPGMNVTSFIKTSRKENTLLVPIQAVTARYNEPLEEKKKDGEKKNHEKSKKLTIKEKREKIKHKKKIEEVVFVVTEDQKIEKRVITKGISDDNYYEVLSGVNEGEEVVTGPFKLLSSRLKDGDKVKVDNEWFERRLKRRKK
jgi:HlyD family secretion protein